MQEKAPLTRALQFANRELIIRGGGPDPVYIVNNTVRSGDQSKGIRGTVYPIKRKLYPSPVPDAVDGNLVTQMGGTLKLGDVQMDIPANQISEEDLKTGAQIMIGYEAEGAKFLNIITYQEFSHSGERSFYRVFARGMINV